MFMSVVSSQFEKWEPFLAAGYWRDTGAVSADVMGGIATVGPGKGIGFLVSTDRPGGNGILGRQPVGLHSSWAFRIDEVAFPIGAIAHWHTHTGSGWRHLVSGSLRIETEEHQDIKRPGDSWFEPADTPVRAVALHDSGVTRFVRAMVIPAAYIGRSTFQLVDPADAVLPHLQVTHRHFDHPVQLDAG